jgi:hypothetical protein
MNKNLAYYLKVAPISVPPSFNWVATSFLFKTLMIGDVFNIVGVSFEVC